MNQEHVGTSYVVENFDVAFPISEFPHMGLFQRQTQGSSNTFRELKVSIPCHEFDRRRHAASFRKQKLWKTTMAAHEFCQIQCTADLDSVTDPTQQVCHIVQFDEFLLNQCGTLRNIVDDVGEAGMNVCGEAGMNGPVIPVPCTLEVAALVKAYAQLHAHTDPFATVAASKSKYENGREHAPELAAWEQLYAEMHFIAEDAQQQYQQDTLLFHVMEAANFLEYYELLHFTAKQIASIVRTLTDKQIQDRLRVRENSCF